MMMMMMVMVMMMVIIIIIKLYKRVTKTFPAQEDSTTKLVYE